MDVRIGKFKTWQLVCPKCSHIEASDTSGLSCGNCGAPAVACEGLSRNGWVSEQARKSWRTVNCTKDCGWSIQSMNCTKCGTTIEGDFIQGELPWCFVASACFEDIDHPTVDHLRSFRDGHLRRYRFGQAFIAWYYTNGPSYARWVSNKPYFKACLRVVFNVLVCILPKK